MQSRWVQFRLIIVGIQLASNLSFGFCRCLCSEFRTRGGSRILCPVALELNRGEKCPDWWYSVAEGTDAESCEAQQKTIHPCSGYKPGVRPLAKSILSADGTYHTCKFQ